MFFVRALYALAFLSWSFGCYWGGGMAGAYSDVYMAPNMMTAISILMFAVPAIVFGAGAVGLRTLIEHRRARALAPDAC